MKLLCFPYAGGSSIKFLSWKKYLDGIEVVAVDPPGRGRRMGEPLCQTIEEMVDDVKKQVVDLVQPKEEYAVYGHSMGTLLVYELLHKLLEDGFHMPVHVFLSGKNAPYIPYKKPVSHLSESEFIKKIVDMGGVFPNFFDYPMMRKVYLSTFRTDFRAVETYHHKTEKRQPLPVDVTFFYAISDSIIGKKSVKQWANYITGFFNLRYFSGGHFFFLGQEEKVSHTIKEILLRNDEEVPY